MAGIGWNLTIDPPPADGQKQQDFQALNYQPEQSSVPLPGSGWGGGGGGGGDQPTTAPYPSVGFNLAGFSGVRSFHSPNNIMLNPPMPPSPSVANRASSFKLPHRPPPPKVPIRGESCDKANRLSRSNTNVNPESYEQALDKMADLMVDVSEPELQKIQGRFNLDK